MYRSVVEHRSCRGAGDSFADWNVSTLSYNRRNTVAYFSNIVINHRVRIGQLLGDSPLFALFPLLFRTLLQRTFRPIYGGFLALPKVRFNDTLPFDTQLCPALSLPCVKFENKSDIVPVCMSNSIGA